VNAKFWISEYVSYYVEFLLLWCWDRPCWKKKLCTTDTLTQKIIISSYLQGRCLKYMISASQEWKFNIIIYIFRNPKFCIQEILCYSIHIHISTYYEICMRRYNYFRSCPTLSTLTIKSQIYRSRFHLW